MVASVAIPASRTRRHPSNAKVSPRSGLADHLRLVQADHRFGECIVVRIASAPDRGLDAGHVSRAVGAAAASDSGRRSIEHLLAIPVPCTPAESIALLPRFPLQSALGRCTSENLGPLYARCVRNGTWVTPTFVAQILPMPDSIPRGADSVGHAMLAKRMSATAGCNSPQTKALCSNHNSADPAPIPWRGKVVTRGTT